MARPVFSEEYLGIPQMPADFGSLTKETPLAKLVATIQAVTPGMPYADLLGIGRTLTHRDAPGLVRRRFLLVDESNRIVHDRFLSIATSEGLESPRVRKIMYFVWAYRDKRLRRFVCERIANREGKWRVSELTKKANAGFFEEWFQKSSIKKIRSNIEYFFVETRILDPETRSVHLELDDGWLPDAMQVAAQHEPNPARRRAMTSAPIQFLLTQEWQGLANATADELLGLDRRVPPAEDPLGDEEIDETPTSLAPARTWEPREMSARQRARTIITINEVARERANASHQLLERIFAMASRAQGFDPQCNAHIDMYFATPSGVILIEMKSCQHGNLHSQVRRGVSQLLEYHYLYRNVLTPTAGRILVLETRPGPQKLWLIPYLESLGITLAWKDSQQDRIVTTAGIPPILSSIILPHA